VEIAHNAVSILLKNLDDSESEFCNKIISNRLIERESTEQMAAQRVK
jgi:DNA-binding LacI/PurR family transcriptional regulator